MSCCWCCFSFLDFFVYFSKITVIGVHNMLYYTYRIKNKVGKSKERKCIMGYFDTTLCIKQKETSVRAFYEITEQKFRTDYGCDTVKVVDIRAVVLVKDPDHPPKTSSMGKDVWESLKPYQEQKLCRIAMRTANREIH